MLEAEVAFEDSPLGPKRKYRQRFRCSDCGHEWKSRWSSAPVTKDPPCPNPSCQQVRQLRQAQIEIQNLRKMIEEQKAPGQIGSPEVKKVDWVAETTMQSYGMTDLKDNLREGDTMAPKLAPKAQAAADNYFKPAETPATAGMRMTDLATGKMRTARAEHLNKIAERAVKGAYRHRAVGPQEVVPAHLRNVSPLQVVRTEANPHFRGR